MVSGECTEGAPVTRQLSNWIPTCGKPLPGLCEMRKSDATFARIPVQPSPGFQFYSFI